MKDYVNKLKLTVSKESLKINTISTERGQRGYFVKPEILAQGQCYMRTVSNL